MNGKGLQASNCDYEVESRVAQPRLAHMRKRFDVDTRPQELLFIHSLQCERNLSTVLGSPWEDGTCRIIVYQFYISYPAA
jgi:hypothetical protein